jgi:hypothetical protein
MYQLNVIVAQPEHALTGSLAPEDHWLHPVVEKSSSVD